MSPSRLNSRGDRSIAAAVEQRSSVRHCTRPIRWVARGCDALSRSESGWCRRSAPRPADSSDARDSPASRLAAESRPTSTSRPADADGSYLRSVYTLYGPTTIYRDGKVEHAVPTDKPC